MAMDTEFLEKVATILKSFDDLDTADEQYYSRLEIRPGIADTWTSMRMTLRVRNNSQKWGVDYFFTEREMPYICEKLEQMQAQIMEGIRAWKIS